MTMSNEQLEKELTDLYEGVAQLSAAIKEGFEESGKTLQLIARKVKKHEEAHCRADNEMANLQKKVAEMDKYFNQLSAENNDLHERVKKLEQLTNPESGQ